MLELADSRISGAQCEMFRRDPLDAKITKATKKQTENSHAKPQRRKGLKQSGFNTVSRTNILGKGIAIRISANC
jgi:hypothetical protein